MRELENVIRRAHVVAKGDAILPAILPPEIKANGPPAPPAPKKNPGKKETDFLGDKNIFGGGKKKKKRKVIPAVERELIIQALKETNGNQVQAAKLLGITRATLAQARGEIQNPA